MTNLTVFSDAKLPTASTIQGLRSLQTNSVTSGTTILKMDKTGYWVFGADSTDIDPETEWAINPNEFLHGYIAWGEGVVLGEKMVSVSQPRPELDPAPSGARKGWETQLGMSLQATNGEDVGLAVRYTATSVGGRNAIQQHANPIAEFLRVATRPQEWAAWCRHNAFHIHAYPWRKLAARVGLSERGVI